MKRFLLIRRVVGRSMEPTLLPKKLVIATGVYRRLAPEQVVVVRHEGLDKVKRIEKIRDDTIFVVGDNPRASLDSRSFGWLPRGSVVGKVLWPRL